MLCRDAPQFSASRIHLHFLSGRRTLFFLQYLYNDFNKIVHYRPLDRRHYSSPYWVVLVSTVFAICFISWALLCLSNNPLRVFLHFWKPHPGVPALFWTFRCLATHPRFFLRRPPEAVQNYRCLADRPCKIHFYSAFSTQVFP